MASTLGSHPGAILFRMSVMALVIAILSAVFFSYLDESRQAIERGSVAHTLRIVDSTLAVAFTSYAVKRRLAALAEIDGANPFALMREFDMVLPPAYQGVVEARSLDGLSPGWYFLSVLDTACYKSRFAIGERCFRVTLRFDDLNATGKYEPGVDGFRNLDFTEVDPPA